MKKLLIAAPVMLLAACGDEASDEAPVETGGEASGDVLEGTISDDMLPLDQITSTSPPAERTTTTTVTTSSDGGETTAETSTTTTSGEDAAPAPAPPEPPATPEQ